MSPLLILIFGVLSASFALLIELTVLNLGALHRYDSLTFDFSSLTLLALVAVIEESSKYLFLRQYLLRFFSGTPLRQNQVLGLGLSFGAGFASLEVAFSLSGGATENSLFWLLGNLLLHSATGLIILFFLKYDEKRLLSAAAIPLALSIVIHLLYNSALSFWFS